MPVGIYILDFACRTLRIAVELDGSQHLDAVAYDGERTAFLEKLGWQVLRFWNSDVRENADGVVDPHASHWSLSQRGPTLRVRAKQPFR